MEKKLGNRRINTKSRSVRIQSSGMNGEIFVNKEENIRTVRMNTRTILGKCPSIFLPLVVGISSLFFILNYRKMTMLKINEEKELAKFHWENERNLSESRRIEERRRFEEKTGNDWKLLKMKMEHEAQLNEENRRENQQIIQRQQNISNFENERKIRFENERRQDEILNNFFEEIEKFFNQYRSSTKNENDLNASVRLKTLNAVRQIDGTRRSLIVKFLYELGFLRSTEKMFLVDLSMAELDDLDLRKFARFDGLSLRGASLRRSSFENLELNEADFSGAQLDGSRFSSSALKSSTFIRASLNDVQFNGVVATRSNFRETSAVRVNFDRANLDESFFDRSKLINSSFIGTSLRSTNFARSILSNSNFSFCQCRETVFDDGAQLDKTDFRYAKLNAAQFLSSKVNNGNFFNATAESIIFLRVESRNTDFSLMRAVNGDFRQADLHRSKFYRANLRHSSFDEANLFEVDFAEASIFEATMLTNLLNETQLETSAASAGLQLNRGKTVRHTNLIHNGNADCDRFVRENWRIEGSGEVLTEPIDDQNCVFQVDSELHQEVSISQRIDLDVFWPKDYWKFAEVTLQAQFGMGTELRLSAFDDRNNILKLEKTCEFHLENTSNDFLLFVSFSTHRRSKRKNKASSDPKHELSGSDRCLFPRD